MHVTSVNHAANPALQQHSSGIVKLDMRLIAVVNISEGHRATSIHDRIQEILHEAAGSPSQ